MTTVDCPTDAELAAFTRGELPSPALDRVADHLERCTACDARVRRYDKETDPVLDALRGPAPTFEKVQVLDPALFAATMHWKPVGAAAPELAAQLPGYDILEVLGQGGMGVVHKARHRKLKRLVALKRLRATTDWDVQRFRREAEAVARLQHPNIVQIYEVGEHEGQPFLALEFVDGGSLDRYLAGKPLPARAAAELVATLARTVQ